MSYTCILNPACTQTCIRGFTTQVLKLGGSGSLWVAGGPGLTKLSTNPAHIMDGAAIFTSPNSRPILHAASSDGFISMDLRTAPGVDHACQKYMQDSCCTEGHWDAGLSVSRSSGTVYIASSCSKGMVRFKFSNRQ